MQIHRLKTWPSYFAAVVDGSMPFQVRRNDRDFQVGDKLELREWDPAKGQYTGRSAFVRVVSIFFPAAFTPDDYPIGGVLQGYCVMGIRLLGSCGGTGAVGFHVEGPFPGASCSFRVTPPGPKEGWGPAAEACVVFGVDTGCAHTQLYLTPAEAIRLAQLLRDAAGEGA